MYQNFLPEQNSKILLYQTLFSVWIRMKDQNLSNREKTLPLSKNRNKEKDPFYQKIFLLLEI